MYFYMCVCVCPVTTPSPTVTRSPEMMGGLNIAAAVAIPVVLLLLLLLLVIGVVVGTVLHVYLKSPKHGLCYQLTLNEVCILNTFLCRKHSKGSS